MEPVSLVIGALVTAGVSALAWRTLRLKASEAWRQSAEACGLVDIEVRKRRQRLTGRRGAHAVRIERATLDQGGHGTRVTIDGLEPAIDVRREHIGARIGRIFGETDHSVGDPGLDAMAELHGPETLLGALLDVEARAQLRRALGGVFDGPGGVTRTLAAKVTVREGSLRCDFADGTGETQEPGPEALADLLALAARLAPVADVPARLARNLDVEPLAAIRLKTLDTLVRLHPDAPATRAALRASLRDGQPEVRLQAALSLPEEGRPVLSALATSAEVPDRCSADALEALGADAALARTLLESALAAGRVRTAAVAVRALGATGEAAEEEPLLRALEQGPDAVRGAAAAALGLVGTARAVMSLREDRAGSSRATERAAREAIARIQARLVGASPGQVALAGDLEGRVTVADDARGRVTIDADERQND